MGEEEYRMRRILSRKRRKRSKRSKGKSKRMSRRSKRSKRAVGTGDPDKSEF